LFFSFQAENEILCLTTLIFALHQTNLNLGLLHNTHGPAKATQALGAAMVVGSSSSRWPF